MTPGPAIKSAQSQIHVILSCLCSIQVQNNIFSPTFTVWSIDVNVDLFANIHIKLIKKVFLEVYFYVKEKVDHCKMI